MKSTDTISKPILAGLMLAIILASFAVYFNVLSNGFVFDDEDQILKNPWIRDFGYIPTVFSHEVWEFKGPGLSNYYRPLMHVAYMLTYHLFGINAWGFHLVNIILHAGASILVFLAGAELLKRTASREVPLYMYPPFIAAILFAVHPIHTEAVAWVAGISDLSYSFFFLGSFYFHIKASDDGLPARNKYLTLSVVLFFCATLCKETALILPILLVVYDYTFKRAGITFTKLWKRYLPYLAVIGLYFAMRIHALGNFVRLDRHSELSNYECFINIFPLFIRYIGKLVLPIDLAVIHEFHPARSFFEAKVFLSFIATLAIVYCVYLSARKTKLIAVGFAFIIIPLLPSFYIRAIPYPFAERYLYLPSVGFLLIIAAVMVHVQEKPRWRPALAVAMLIVITLYSVGTVHRNMVWKDNYTLWSDTVLKSPDDAIVHYNLGAALKARGRGEEAITQYRIAISLKPDPEMYRGLGSAYADLGRKESAIAQYLLSLRMQPGNARTHNDLGAVYGDMGLFDRAIEHLLIAVNLEPANANTRYNLGLVYRDKGLPDAAIEQFEAALRLKPEDAEILRHLREAQELKRLAGKPAGEVDRK